MKEILSKIITSKKITQDDYNRFVKSSFDNIENPKDYQKMEYHNSIHGGKCIFCNSLWIKKEKKISEKNNEDEKVNDYYIDYIYFDPSCDCLKKIKDRIEYKKQEILFNKYSNIPIIYHNSYIENMDQKISPEIINAIEKIKNYLNEKTYKNFGLVLYGDIGTGKTHISVAVMKKIAIDNNLNAYFLHMSNFISNIITDKNYINQLLKNDIILLDDIDKANTGIDKDNKWINEQVFSLINGLVADKKLIIATSNLSSIKEFTNIYDNSVVSRIIGSCLFINIKGDDYRLKRKGII